MRKESIFTLLQVFENDYPCTMILLNETLLTISKSDFYIQRFIEAHTTHTERNCYDVEVIPVIPSKNAYTPAELQKEYDLTHNFDVHMFFELTTEQIKSMNL